MNLFLDILFSLIANLVPLGGNPQVTEQTGAFTRYELTDSTSLEIYEAENITVVMTACAPQCSSRACVYNKEGKFLYPIEAPFTSVFPLASIDKESGQVIWKDNDTWEY